MSGCEHEYGEVFFAEDCGPDGVWLRVCRLCNASIAIDPPPKRRPWQGVPQDYGDPRSNR